MLKRIFEPKEREGNRRVEKSTYGTFHSSPYVIKAVNQGG
jgi:hypothetical protein